jgi:hypothetical protein
MGQEDYRQACLDLQIMAGQSTNTYYTNDVEWHEAARRYFIRMQAQMAYIERILEIQAERSFDVQSTPGQET